MEEAAGFVVGAEGKDGEVAEGKFVVFAIGIEGGAGVAELAGGEGDEAHGEAGPAPVAVEGVVDGKEHGGEFFEHVVGGFAVEEVAAGAGLAGEVDAKLELGVELVFDDGFGLAAAGEAEAADVGSGFEGEVDEFGEVGAELDVVFHDDGVFFVGLEEHAHGFEVAEVAGNLVDVGGFAVAEAVATVRVVGVREFKGLAIDGLDEDHFERRGGGEQCLAGFAAFNCAFEVDDEAFHDGAY